MSTLIQRLRNLAANIENETDMAELVAMGVDAGAIIAGYNTYSLEVPQWLSDAKAQLDKTISDKSRDSLMAELKRTEQGLEALKSSEEKKVDLRERQERLKKRLGL